MIKPRLKNLPIQFEPQQWILPVSLRHSDLGFPWEAMMNQAPNKGVWVLEAQQLSSIDSSALAFFIACLRVAKARGIQLKIQHLHANIMALLKAYGILILFEGVLDGTS